MISSCRRTYKFSRCRRLLAKVIPYFRISILLIAFIEVIIIAFGAIDSFKTIESVEALSTLLEEEAVKQNKILIISPNNIEFVLDEPDKDEILAAEVRLADKIERIAEEKRRQEEIARNQYLAKVGALSSFLSKYNSPMVPYAELILNSCEKYGTEYCKIYLSIAGVESGFGRLPIGCCNAWGLMGIYYPSWQVSIPKSCNSIAQNYYLQGVNTIEKLAYSSYGPQDAEAWIQHLYYYYYRIPL